MVASRGLRRDLTREGPSRHATFKSHAARQRAAFFFAVAVSGRFAFWYWGLLQLGRDQARMIVVDTRWGEDRRELSRQEKWRGAQKGTILGKAREKFGCGGWFLAIGLPLILLFLFLIVLCCSGGIR